MKEKYINCLLIAIILLLLNSCRETDKPISKKVRSQQYAVEINTWSFYRPDFEVFLYNTGIETYSSKRRESSSTLEENTLYILKHLSNDEFGKTDTLKLKLTTNQVDSLYILAYAYLSNFEIDNEIEPGKKYKYLHHGADISVSLSFFGKRMTCEQYRLKGISSASKEAESLFNFINKKVPKEFQLY